VIHGTEKAATAQPKNLPPPSPRCIMHLDVNNGAGVLTWQNRTARIQVRERDLFGQVIRFGRVLTGAAVPGAPGVGT
jgi:hypothetical protein